MIEHGARSARAGLMGVVFALVAATAAAEEVVVSDDGRQIRLNDDGTWRQVGGVSYATTASGARVRLRPDGSWQVLDAGESAAVPPPAVVRPELEPAAMDVSLELNQVEILRRKIKRSKTTHSQTVTVYHFSVRNEGNNLLRLGDDLIDELRARSSSGGEWPIVSMDIDQPELTRGQQAVIRVVADGAPQWFGVKYMELQVAPGALGNRERIKLRKPMKQVERRSVN